MLRVARGCTLVALAMVAVGLAPGAASAGDGTAPLPANALAADASQPGIVNLIFRGTPGTRVAFAERVGDKLEPLGSATVGEFGAAAIGEATTWRCDRLVRNFEATATLPDGSRAQGAFSVRTMSCASRFELSLPRGIDPGERARIRVIDRWRLGNVRPDLCLTPPGGRAACIRLPFAAAVSVAAHRLRAQQKGRWRVELRIGRDRVRGTFGVGVNDAPAKRPPVVLTTGDSTMQGIDSFLADRLGNTATVRSDTFVGTGISYSLEWNGRAESQVTRFKPRTTVVSVGANDGAPMKTPANATIDCCGETWIAEYARRVRAMMRDYTRAGKGRVLWLALPEPRDPRRVEITRAVNRAIVAAGAGLARVAVVRLDLLFTPDGYRDVMRHRGQKVRVREPDGIHLNVAGTSIAAEAVEAAMREG